MESNFIDLTVGQRPQGQEFSDDEDEAAFGTDRQVRMIYVDKIWKLKQNDPNHALLGLAGIPLSDEMCQRIGIYLWQSKHIKNIQIHFCDLTIRKMKHLFGAIASQIKTNQFILRHDILSQAGIHEKTLVNGIVERVTSFSQLLNVNVSENRIGTRGLDILVRALAGSPIQTLSLSACGLNGIQPLRGLRNCAALNTLDLSGNMVGMDDFCAVSVLMDNGHPKLRNLDLQSCGIGDDLIGIISPILAGNKSLRYLILHNYVEGESNRIGQRGITALSKALYDSSSFKKTLLSNHTIWKIPVGSELNLDLDISLSSLLMHNLRNSIGGTNTRVRHRIAWEKHITYIAGNDGADLSPFLDTDIKLIPHLIKQTSRVHCYNSTKALSALFKVMSCNVFRERINAASRIDELESENARLKQQIAELLVRDAKPGSGSNDSEVAAGSIAARVKSRASKRKRGKK